MEFKLKHPGCVYIGGEWQPTDVLEDVINTADESLLGRAPVGSAAQVEAAIASARHAFDSGDWPRLPVAQRQTVLNRFLDAIEARKDELVAVWQGRVDTGARGLPAIRHPDEARSPHGGNRQPSGADQPAESGQPQCAGDLRSAPGSSARASGRRRGVHPTTSRSSSTSTR